MYYAHTHPERPWEPLEAHLHRVADKAAQFAAIFDAEGWGQIAGLWRYWGTDSAECKSCLQIAGQRVGVASGVPSDRR
jgi:hypothetical protein